MVNGQMQRSVTSARSLSLPESVWPYRLLTLVVVLSVWEVYARIEGSPLTFPAFSAVAVALGELVQSPELWQATWTTLQSFLLGFPIGVAIGILFGVVIALSPVVARLSGFYVRLLLTMPMSSVVPIAIALLGLGLGSRVALVVLFVVGVVTVNTATGLRSASPQLTEMARSFYASPTLTFLRVRLPAAIPSIMAGLRLGAGRGVVGMVVAELIISPSGLGRLIVRYRAQFHAAEMFGVVVVLLVLGVLILRSVRLAENRMLHWQRK
ncbi:MAG: ABC transporter permease [Chloroflexi bacterium]|nr:ABC transporter permease [Chloroflexota bacterium]